MTGIPVPAGSEPPSPAVRLVGAQGQAGLPVQLSAFGFRDFLIVCSAVTKAKPIGVENTQIS